jgi:hypothetical protein
MRSRERGSVIVVMMVLIAALLAGGAVLASMQHSSSRGGETTHMTSAGLYCAEAGLTAVRSTVALNAPWTGSLGAPTEPAWLAGVNHDIDGNGKPDFTITLRDNDDEAANDPAVDSDQTIYIVSTCIGYPDVNTQVAELVKFSGPPERRLWIRLQ